MRHLQYEGSVVILDKYLPTYDLLFKRFVILGGTACSPCCICEVGILNHERRAKDLREMLITVASYRSLYLRDQRSFVRYYLTNRSSVMIDSDGSLFATLHGVTKSSVITKGPKISIGDVDEIAVVHGNAGGLGGKRYYEEITRAMISVAKSHNPGVTVEVQPPLYSSAVAYYQSGHISKAIEHFEMHLAGEPDHVESMYNLGVTYSEIEDWKSSRAWYQRCLSADES